MLKDLFYSVITLSNDRPGNESSKKRKYRPSNLFPNLVIEYRDKCICKTFDEESGKSKIELSFERGESVLFITSESAVIHLTGYILEEKSELNESSDDILDFQNEINPDSPEIVKKRRLCPKSKINCSFSEPSQNDLFFYFLFGNQEYGDTYSEFFNLFNLFFKYFRHHIF